MNLLDDAIDPDTLVSYLPDCALIQWLCLALLILRTDVPGVCQPGVALWLQPSPLLVASAELNSFSADQLIAFAEQLMREGEYFRAITEYRRFLFYYPDDPRHAMIHFRIGLALYRGESYGEALQT